MFFGGVEFERNRSYELNYTLSCRSYGSRKGCIKFHVNHHDIKVEHKYPKRRRKYLIKLREFLSGKNSSEPHIDLLNMDVNWKSESKCSMDVLLKNTGSVRHRVSEIRFDLFLGETKTENYFTSIPLRVWGLDPGEFWKSNIEFNIDQPDLFSDTISIDYSLSASTNPLVNGWERIELVDSGAELPKNSHSIPQVYGRLENLNAGTTRKLRVVVKWIDRNKRVISSDESRIELDPGEAKDFRINSSLKNEAKEKIDDYSIVLMSG